MRGKLWTICYCVVKLFRSFGTTYSRLFTSIGLCNGGWWTYFLGGGIGLGNINLIPLCLMWTVWRERNSNTFEDVSSSSDQLLGNFVMSLYEWVRIWGFTTADTVTEFVASWHSGLLSF